MGADEQPILPLSSKARYARVLLKVSGEGLAGPEGFGIGGAALDHVARELREVHELGVQIGVVVGGGNILRGETFARNAKIAEATAHYMGMLATVMNALALQETLEAMDLQTRVLSSLEVAQVCEPYIRRRAIHHLEKGRIVILAAGTGRPFVTTDTAAALSAVELKAAALFKATQVDGVYSADPKKNPAAEFYEQVSYDRVIDERLKVMDMSAIDLCQRNHVPIIVFNLHEPGNMRRIIEGQCIGTVISK
jgi:uridylate kinase